MHRRVASIACAGLAVMTAAALGVSPSASFAAEVWRWLAAIAAFAAVVVGFPVLLNLRAHGTPVPWRRMGRFLARETPIEAAVVMMIAASLLLGGSASGGLAGVAALGFGVSFVAFVMAGVIEQLWGYLEPDDAPAAS